MELIEGRLRVQLEDIGEGWWGDYDPDDAEDEPLLRFYTSRLTDEGEWEDLDDGSYCTALRTDTDPEELERSLAAIMRSAKMFTDAEGRRQGGFKRAMEQMSWLGVKRVIEKMPPSQLPPWSPQHPKKEQV